VQWTEQDLEFANILLEEDPAPFPGDKARAPKLPSLGQSLRDAPTVSSDLGPADAAVAGPTAQPDTAALQWSAQAARLGHRLDALCALAGPRWSLGQFAEAARLTQLLADLHGHPDLLRRVSEGMRRTLQYAATGDAEVSDGVQRLVLPLLRQGSRTAYDARILSTRRFIFGAAVPVSQQPGPKPRAIKVNTRERLDRALSNAPAEAGRIRVYAAANDGGACMEESCPLEGWAEVVVDSGEAPTDAGTDADAHRQLMRCTALLRGGLMVAGALSLAAKVGKWPARLQPPVDAAVAAAGGAGTKDAAWLRAAAWVPLAGGAVWLPMQPELVEPLVEAPLAAHPAGA
jgi:hypothetical protein